MSKKTSIRDVGLESKRLTELFHLNKLACIGCISVDDALLVCEELRGLQAINSENLLNIVDPDCQGVLTLQQLRELYTIYHQATLDKNFIDEEAAQSALMLQPLLKDYNKEIKASDIKAYLYAHGVPANRLDKVFQILGPIHDSKYLAGLLNSLALGSDIDIPSMLFGAKEHII